MEDAISQIFEIVKVWWNETEEKELFTRKGVFCKYDPYMLKFEEPTYANMIKVRVFIFLDITFGNIVLLDAGEVYDYNVNAASIENLHSELLRISEDAHLHFLRTWEDKGSSLYIHPRFVPTFDPLVAHQKCLSVLQTGDGL